jgi:hypothetical protein
MYGWTDNYVRIATTYSSRLVNTIQTIKIGNYSDNGFHFGILDTHLQREETAIEELIE